VGCGFPIMMSSTNAGMELMHDLQIVLCPDILKGFQMDPSNKAGFHEYKLGCSELNSLAWLELRPGGTSSFSKN
jgi:hypothetical protein